MKTPKKLLLLLLLPITFFSCELLEEVDDEGDSESTVLPSSIMAYNITFTTLEIIEAPEGLIIPDYIYYEFVSPTKVYGAGAAELDTETWSYTRSGNRGTVFLDYGELGTETFILEDSDGQLTYEYTGVLLGTTGRTRGTFAIGPN